MERLPALLSALRAIPNAAARQASRIALLVLLAPVAPVHATLIGSAVGCTATETQTQFDTGFQCSPATKKVGEGAEFQLRDDGSRSQFGESEDVLNIDLDGFTIKLFNPESESFTFLTGDDPGDPGDTLSLTVLDWAGPPGSAITGVDLITFGNDLALEDISFTDDSVTVVLGGSTWAADSTAAIGLEISAAAVPEPATLALIGLGIAALGYRRRGRRFNHSNG